MTKFILASASPRRKLLLGLLGLEFETVESDVDEKVDMPPYEMVSELSKRKAVFAAKSYGGSVVIGADTIVVQDGVIMGKPVDEGDAFKMLNRLSGKMHTVYTGVCVVKDGNPISAVETTNVYMSKLDEREINSYIKTGEPMDKAGAYGIQGEGAKFIERIEGCYYNIVGLPVNRLWGLLKSIGAL